MIDIKQQLFSGWHVGRWLRLIIGMAIMMQAIAMGELLLGVFAAFFLFQALTNTGCCGAGSCSIPPGKENVNDTSSAFREK